MFYKAKKRLIASTLAGVMALSIIPNSGIVYAKKKNPTKLSKTAIILNVGEKKVIKLKKAPVLTKKKIKKVKWKSSNEKVATVTVKGKKKDKAVVKAVGAGKATIKLKYNGKSYKCIVGVLDKATTTSQVTTEIPSTTEKPTTEAPTKEEPSTEEPSTEHTHQYGAWKVITAATCIKDGTEERRCACGNVESRTVKAAGHKWDEGKVTTEPTYTSAGVKTYTCSVCDETKKESIPMLTETDHAWDEGKITKEATCAEMGIKTYICKNCGGVKTENIPTLLTHTWNDGIVTKPATYTESGIKTFTCQICGAAKTEAIPMLTETEHKWDSGKVTIEPTCVKTGIKTYTCANCGGTKTEIISATGHQYNSGVITTAPTYTKPGVKTFTCAVCGDQKTEEIPKLIEIEHNWDAGEVTTAATCTEAGVKTYTCQNCGKTKTEEIAATGHQYDNNNICQKCALGNPSVYCKTVDVSKDNKNPVYAYYTETGKHDSSNTVLYDVVVRPAQGHGVIKARAFKDDKSIRDVTFANRSKVDGIVQIGTVVLTYLDKDASHMFDGCKNLRTVDVSGMYSANAKDMSYFFNGSGIESIVNNNSGFGFIFHGNCEYALASCHDLAIIPDSIISGEAKITDATGMCLSDENLSVVPEFYIDGGMSAMFAETNITNVSIYGEITRLENAFYSCNSLTKVYIENASYITTLAYAFERCPKLSSITWGPYNNSGNLVNATEAFAGDTALTEIDLSVFTNTDKLQRMVSMFSGCTSLKKAYRYNDNCFSKTSESFGDSKMWENCGISEFTTK